MGTKSSRRSLRVLIWSLFATCFFPLSGGTAEVPAKITIGAIEEVILIPWGIQVPARIDTGAATSSLDVCEVKRLGKKEIEFTLPERCGGNRVRMPIVAWRHVQSAEGGPESRPVVEIELCLGSKRVRTQITLNDRSRMEYPLLIGRRALEGNFIVDVGRSYTALPSCSEGNLR